MVIALAVLYLRFGGLPWMQGIFYGVGAAVIAIIARSTIKLAKLTLARDYLLWALFGVTAIVTAVTESEIIWLFLASGALAMMVKAPPRFLRGRVGGVVPPLFLSGVHGVALPGTVGKLALFFTKAGAFVFGSGLAIVPFLYKGVVHDFQWLDDRQFRDAVAVAMITPGPVVITSGFIGYLVAGLCGAIVAAAGTFVPPYLVVVLAARYVRKATANPSLKAFVGGVTAAATGAIAGAAFILGRRALVDVVTVSIALATLVALFTVKKLPEPLLIAFAGIIGLALNHS
jgi:chromate transporter